MAAYGVFYLGAAYPRGDSKLDVTLKRPGVDGEVFFLTLSATSDVTIATPLRLFLR